MTEEQVTLTEYETTVMAQAAREFLMNKLYYGLMDLELRSALDFAVYQRVIGAITTIYGRMVMMSTPDNPTDTDLAWMGGASLSPETWAATNAVELGSSWDDIPIHKWHDHGCGLCDDIMSVPIGRGETKR